MHVKRNSIALLVAGAALGLSAPAWLHAAEGAKDGNAARPGGSSTSMNAPGADPASPPGSDVSGAGDPTAQNRDLRAGGATAGTAGVDSSAGSTASGSASGTTAGSGAMGGGPTMTTPPAAGAPSPATPGAAAGGAMPKQHSAGILNMTADQLKGRPVVDTQGRKIAEIQRVVQSKTGKGLFAVLSAGGFLGIGGERIAIPIETLQLSGDRITLTGITTADQLRQQQKYDEKNYTAIEGDQVLANAARRGEQARGGGQASTFFSALDKNSDGYISSDEAQQSSRLSERWQSYDMNRDGQLDQVEFSAFEASSDEMQPGGTGAAGGGSTSAPIRDSNGLRERPDRESSTR